MNRALQTRVPEITYRRAFKLAAAEGLSLSKWLMRLVLVATQKTDAGRAVRGKVAETLAIPEGRSL